MATIDQQDTVVERPRFCPECGQPAGEANFCPGCGHNMGFAADRTLAHPSVQSGAAGGRSRPDLKWVVALGALGLAAVAAAAVILLSGGSGSKPATGGPYQRQLATALSPLVSANQALSAALTAVNGSKATIGTAKTDAAQALTALSAAHGAVGVLAAPRSQSSLSAQVQQALTADSGYLQAVSATLATPSGSSTGQLQTLATGAQSALDPLATVVSGASTSISGTGNLVSWAQGASAKPKARQAPSKTTSPPTTTVTSATPAPAPAPALTSCGQSVSVNSDTSCPFAVNLFTEYALAVANGAPFSTDVTAASPVTGDTYTDSCQYEASSGMVSCSHGTDLVQFPESAAGN